MTIFYGIVLFWIIMFFVTLLIFYIDVKRYPVCPICGDNFKVDYDKKRRKPFCRKHGYFDFM